MAHVLPTHRDGDNGIACSRARNAGAANFAALAQNLSPRILRFGAKITF
jgi:hypothetical protein